jgi:hypothetical protein
MIFQLQHTAWTAREGAPGVTATAFALPALIVSLLPTTPSVPIVTTESERTNPRRLSLMRILTLNFAAGNPGSSRRAPAQHPYQPPEPLSLGTMPETFENSV